MVVIGAGRNKRPRYQLSRSNWRQQGSDVNGMADGLTNAYVIEWAAVQIKSDVPPGVGLIGIQLHIAIVLQLSQISWQYAHEGFEALVVK